MVNPKDILNVGAVELERGLDFELEFLDAKQEHQHDGTVLSVAMKKVGQVNKELLERCIKRLIRNNGANLYR